MRRRAFLAGAAALTLPAAPVQAGPRRFRVRALGQALLQHDMLAQHYDGFDALAARLGGADVVFGQLETVLEGAGTEAPTRDLETLHVAPPTVLRTLRALSVNLLATAGNHAFDLGTGGVVSTLRALDADGFVHAGTGLDLAAASAPAFLQTRPGRVALVAMATGKIRAGGAATPDRPGVNELRQQDGAIDPGDAARCLASIARAAREADLVIAYHHNHDWHAPDAAVTPPWLEDWARRCVEHGAHLFVGHGFPGLQGIELHRGRPLLYDLASLFFQTRTPPGRYPPEAWESAVADLSFVDGRVQQIELVPLLLNERGDEADPLATRGRPRIARGADAARILDRIARLSARYGTRLVREGDIARWRR
jgi:poly-gamma-glutamate capsule biosynthesis protein CapA/YwtB (metallophosphatase superfamily)